MENEIEIATKLAKDIAILIAKSSSGLSDITLVGILESVKMGIVLGQAGLITKE